MTTDKYSFVKDYVSNNWQPLLIGVFVGIILRELLMIVIFVVGVVAVIALLSKKTEKVKK